MAGSSAQIPVQAANAQPELRAGPKAAFARALAAPVVALPVSFGLIALIGAADYITGYEVRLAILYLLPIALATSACGRRWGLVMALLGPAIWVASFAKQHPYTSDVYFFWENVVMGVTFIVVVELLARLQDSKARLQRQITTMLEVIPAAGFLAEHDGTIRCVNQRLRRLTGVDAPPARESEIAAAFESSTGEPALAGQLRSGRVRSVRDGRHYRCQREIVAGIDDTALMLVVLTEDGEETR